MAAYGETLVRQLAGLRASDPQPVRFQGRRAVRVAIGRADQGAVPYAGHAYSVAGRSGGLVVIAWSISDLSERARPQMDAALASVTLAEGEAAPPAPPAAGGNGGQPVTDAATGVSFEVPAGWRGGQRGSATVYTSASGQATFLVAARPAGAGQTAEALENDLVSGFQRSVPGAQVQEDGPTTIGGRAARRVVIQANDPRSSQPSLFLFVTVREPSRLVVFHASYPASFDDPEFANRILASIRWGGGAGH